LHWLRASDCHAIPQAMPHDRPFQFGNHDTRAARLVVDVWLWLARVMLVDVARAVIVVMMAAIMLVVIMVMMAMINMTKLSPLVGVDEQTGKGAGRDGCSQTERGRNRKHNDHSPDEGDVASAHSF
jgi:hypothetical protein